MSTVASSHSCPVRLYRHRNSVEHFVLKHDLGLLPSSPVTDVQRCEVARLETEYFQSKCGPFEKKDQSGLETKISTRSLTLDWFSISLPNGDVVQRTWMRSPSKKALFCLPCVLFSERSKIDCSFATTGFHQWWKLNP